MDTWAPVIQTFLDMVKHEDTKYNIQIKLAVPSTVEYLLCPLVMVKLPRSYSSFLLLSTKTECSTT